MRLTALVLFALVLSAQTSLFNVATGTACSATLSGSGATATATINCTANGAPVLTGAAISLQSLIGLTNGIMIQLNQGPDAITMQFTRRLAADPLTVAVVVNGAAQPTRTFPIP